MTTTNPEAAVLRRCYREPMECPRCGEVHLYQLADEPSTDTAGRKFIELECTSCGHYETGAVS